MSPRRVALYGGSFDPPHVGHVLAIAYVLAAEPVDQVLLMPCYQHAFAKELAPFQDRLELCRAVAALFAPGRVQVSDLEARLGGVSRTIDTVDALVSEDPEREIDLVLGTDLFAERAAWKSFDELERRCRFIVLARPGDPVPEGVAPSPPFPDVSSTDVRRRLRQGEPVAGLVPITVERLLRERGLYGT